MLDSRHRPRGRHRKELDTREKIALVELRIREADAIRVEERGRNQGRLERIKIETANTKLTGAKVDLARKCVRLVHDVLDLIKHAAFVVLGVVVAVLLIIAALSGPEPYTAMAIVPLLGGGVTIGLLLGKLRRGSG